MKEYQQKLLVFLVLLIVFTTSVVYAYEEMQVHFLDVGQGESILLQGPDFTILIDAGDRGKNDVVAHLKRLGVKEIDLLLLTHPHADHIGQVANVLHSFPVEEVWMSGYEHYTLLFEEVVDAILQSGAAYYEPRRGDEFTWGNLVIEILHPQTIVSDLHDTNIVVRAVYGDVAFLFMGDAEKKTEDKILASNLPITVNAQILNVGHHGSRTSSSLEFLLAVDPEVAIYSAGVNNVYGHPHPEVVNRFGILDIRLYGTDVQGTVSVCTDGYTYEVLAQENPNRPGGSVDLNYGTLLDLQRIVHIGPVRAKKIVELRAEKPFVSLDDLNRVSGLGTRKINEIKEQGLAYVRE